MRGYPATALSLPANKPVKTYPVKLERDEVFVDCG
jgi:hypothetical protein